MSGGHTEGLTVRDYGEPTALAAAECRFALLHGQDGAPVGYVYRAEDAALYAASPDLFEALKPFAVAAKACDDVLDADAETMPADNPDGCLTVADFRRVVAALAKARGAQE